MHVVWMAPLGAARVKSLGSHECPLGLGFPREAACMARDNQGTPRTDGPRD